MIRVIVQINGRTIHERSAHRIVDPQPDNQLALYKLDNGKTIWYNPEKGALLLTTKLIDSLIEEEEEKNEH